MLRHLLPALFLLLPISVLAQEEDPSLNIDLQPGFQVELIRAAQEGEDSWISMCFDDQGRIILGLDRQGVGRLTFSLEDGTSSFEKVNDNLKHCRGVLYAFDSLYVSATNSKGFYRLKDTTADDQFDEQTLLFELDYRSRYGHGSNQILLGPDKMIYLVVGNDVSFPQRFAENSAYRTPKNDQLLVHQFDADQDNRVGYILRLDAEGEQREIIAGGFRNQVDAVFNQSGDLFTYDADMEWDAGLPWYRPTRLNHVISGGEYGWRWGTMKWPTYYQDSLPTTLDTGYGSPTGMAMGFESHFPERYQQALFMADWQNGRIYIADLIPQGSSYQAEYETFLQGGPLNVCDMVFGPDGALYFITGGRGSRSGLYRVSWTSSHPEPPRPESIRNLTFQTIRDAEYLRACRTQLERYHRVQAPEAVDEIWHHIASPDRWLRFSARVALENQEIMNWKDRALQEATPLGCMTSLLALARVGQPEDQADIFQAIQRHDLRKFTSEVLLGYLRIYAISCSRHGNPPPAVQQHISEQLNSLYPHHDPRVNHELSELLVSLKHPDVLNKTLTLWKDATTQEEEFHYAMTLAHLTEGWTLPQRRYVFQWLQQARGLKGGRLITQTVQNLILTYRSHLSEDETKALADELAQLEMPFQTESTVASLPVIHRWTMEDLTMDLPTITKTPNPTIAQQALAKASCLKCHRIGSQGGQIGPDLTRVGTRFDLKAILESILLPSKVMDEKYRHTSYVLVDGKVVTGRPVGVNAKTLLIETDPILSTSQTINRDEIEEAVISPVSPMPSGLVDVLTRDELLELLAYLKFGS